MEYKEKSNISIPINNETFIYFLLQDKDVVYVGKTNIGLIRPFTHINSEKKFNKVEIINCKYEDLDILEDKYIKKYNPIYNKQLNYNVNYSYDKIKIELYKIFNKKINLRKIKEAIIKCSIKTINYNNGIFIKKGDFNKIIEYITNDRRI